MPVYTYRREDGSTFDFRQSFSDAPLSVDPETGQQVVRVVHNAGIIFKGSGFYINDSKSSSKQSLKGGNGKTDTTKSTGDKSAAKPANGDAKATPAASD
ncbi:MAG: zinc ribbon domain-containing protein [Anaerolineaceae bacterium]|nr:MAG: zinc ribbon domain-containing protein [Anaerolineaceae bacterium]